MQASGWRQVGRRFTEDLQGTLEAGNQFSYLFSDIHIETVNRAISENEDAVESLDAEMEDHMRIIRQLQHKKQQHLAEIRRCKGMITLAKRLPPEILASIFEECVKDGWTRTPLVVSHVCSSWRMASSIPTVWSHVYVNLDTRDPLNRTRLWLEKSQDAPLIINLDVGNEISQLDGVVELLVAEVHRWKELSVKSTMLHPVNLILQGCTKHMPQLTSVNISVDQEFILPVGAAPEERTYELVGLRTSFLDANLLRNLRINRNLLPGPDIIPSSITNLSLVLPSSLVTTRQSMTSLLRLLDSLPQLETLAIEVPSGHSQSFIMDIVQGDPVELPNLRSFVLMGLNNIFGILPRLRLPSLLNLHLRSTLDQAQAEDTGQWIGEFLEASAPPISLLEIRDLAINPSTYGWILPLLPSLRELRLHDSDIQDNVLRQLNGPEGLCRFLEHLDLRWCGRLSGRALVDLVRSRLPGIVEADAPFKDGAKPITEVTVINCSFVREEDILDLSKETVCRLLHKGSDDFCYSYGCCENERYRKRLRQRLLFRPSVPWTPLGHKLIL